MTDQPRFDVGRQVRVHGNPPMMGAIIGSKMVEGNLIYQVFVDQQTKIFVPASRVSLFSLEADFEVVDRDEFLLRLLLFKLRQPLTDTLYSYRASRTHFEVYQFRPVFKFLASDRRSLLIADEVGLGKTIEAALIYLELKARGDLPRVLIACPSALREKWRSELKLRFDEDFAILDRHGLARFFKDFEGTGGLQRLKGIASLELIRDSEIQQSFVEKGVTLDLLVVDEAHHAKNASSETHKTTRMLADRADNVVLLTATPLQTDTSDLFNLLQLVDSASFNDQLSFGFQLAPNRHVNAAIRALGQSPPNLPVARAAIASLSSLPETKASPLLAIASKALLVDDPPMDQVVALRRDLLELNTLSYVFTRTRKRDVQNSAQRTSVTLRVSLSPEERAFYEEMVAQARREVRERGLPAFLVAGRERQAASCLIATRQYLESTVQRRRRDLQLEDGSTDLDASDDSEVKADELDRLTHLVDLSRAVGLKDSKFDLLLGQLPGILEAATGRKVLLFAFYRRTLEYLRERLDDAGYRTYTIHGGLHSADRQTLMERFRSQDEPAILLSSEVGAEGLDFQFADTLINYDLPWNPMRVEQRIGRIDRYGQLSPKIRIISFVLDDTIETRILERLYSRIRIFEESIGDLEPIVGAEIRRLEHDVLSRDLSPEQEVRVADEMVIRLENLRQLQEDFEKQSSELMAPDSVFLSDVTKAVESGRVISSQELAVAVQLWLRARYPGSEFSTTDGETWMLRSTPSLMAALGEYLARTPEKSERAVALLHAMDSTLGVPCTFDDVLAQRRRPLHFLHVRHPLVRLAVEHFQARATDEPEDLVRVTRIRADGPANLAGAYTFFLNVVRVDAINPQMRFVPVVFDADGRARPDVAERLVAWLQGGSRPIDEAVDLERLRVAYEQQHVLMARERDRIEGIASERNVALLETRQTHINRSFDAKIAKRREWLIDARDERIRRMRQAEIGNLEEQRKEKLEQLERGREVRVTYELVTGGTVILDGVLQEPDAVVGPQASPASETAPRPRRRPARQRAVPAAPLDATSGDDMTAAAPATTSPESSRPPPKAVAPAGRPSPSMRDRVIRIRDFVRRVRGS
jgi:superfamily II DNA or RNA helicase